MFCERCGLNFLPKQSVCAHCHVAATRNWFQLMSLVMVLVAVFFNALVGLLMLPRLAAGGHSRFVFRAWLGFDSDLLPSLKGGASQATHPISSSVGA